MEEKTNYKGTENVIVANGSQLSITHVGKTCLQASDGCLKLEDILCVPAVTKNLLSVSKLTQDNNIIVEFHADCCLVKDKESGRILLK